MTNSLFFNSSSSSLELESCVNTKDRALQADLCESVQEHGSLGKLTPLTSRTTSFASSFLFEGGNEQKKNIHENAQICLSANENKGANPIKMENSEKEMAVLKNFERIQSLLHEQRSIYYSITNHMIIAYFPNEKGEEVKKLYALNFDSDIKQLLIDNGMGQDVAVARVNEVYDQLAEINQEMLKDTEVETGTCQRQWIRNEMGNPAGHQMMVTNFFTVNQVICSRNTRLDSRKDAFCDEKRGFFEKKEEKLLVSKKGADFLHQVEAAEALKKAVIEVLQEQITIRQSMKQNTKDMKGLTKLDKEIDAFKEVIKEVYYANMNEVERTMMLMEGNCENGVTGRELAKADLYLLAEKSAQDLKERVSIVNKTGLIFKDAHQVQWQEREAIDAVSSLVFHVADTEDGASVARELHRYQQDHCPFTPMKKPRAEAFLYQGAEFICGKRQRFNAAGLGAKLPPMLDINWQPRLKHAFRNEDGQPLKGQPVLLAINGEPLHGAEVQRVEVGGVVKYVASTDPSQEIKMIAESEIPIWVDSLSLRDRVKCDLEGRLLCFDEKGKSTPLEKKTYLTFEAAMEQHAMNKKLQPNRYKLGQELPLMVTDPMKAQENSKKLPTQSARKGTVGKVAFCRFCSNF